MIERVVPYCARPPAFVDRFDLNLLALYGNRSEGENAFDKLPLGPLTLMVFCSSVTSTPDGTPTGTFPILLMNEIPFACFTKRYRGAPPNLFFRASCRQQSPGGVLRMDTPSPPRT